MRRLKTRLLIGVSFVAVVMAAPAEAHVPATGQTWPGANGPIAFRSMKAGTIFAVESDGSYRHVLVTVPDASISQTSLRWSPDGSHLSFFADPRGGENARPWVVRANGTRLRPVPAPAGRIVALSWSPDGRFVARTYREEADTTAIWTMDRNGSDAERIVPWGQGGGWFDPPLWSSANDRIMFTDGDDIRVVGVDGTDLGGIDRTTPVDNPQWSPDGTRVLYVKERQDVGTDLWTADPDGADPVRLTDHPDGDVMASWSPNGKQITYVHCGSVACAADSFHVHVMDADGTDDIQISLDGTFNNWFPVWSPDGRFVAFHSDRRVWIAASDGSSMRDAGAGYFPAWRSLP